MSQRAVIYARYSSSNQREESIEGQIRVCKQFAAEHDLVVIAEYCDRALTGRNDKRPELQRMIADSNSHLFDFVLVWKGDRIARNRDDKAFYRRKLRNNGVYILSAMEKVPTSPEGIILQSVLDGMDEYYSANLSSNVKRGMHENLLNGKFNGSYIPFGYIVDENRCLAPSPLTSSIVPLFYRMFLDGHSLKDLITYAKTHGIKVRKNIDFSFTSMKKLLSNEKYIGIYRFNDAVNYDAIPPLVNKDVFDAVQSELKRYSRKVSRLKHPDKVSNTFLLSGKLTCGTCHANICGDSGTSKNGNKHYYYTCISRKQKKPCTSKSIRQNTLDIFVMNAVSKIVMQQPVINTLSNALFEHQENIEIHSTIHVLQSREKKVIKAIDNLLDLAMTMQKSSRLSEKLQALESELIEVRFQIDKENITSSALSRDQISFWLYQLSSGDIQNADFQNMLVHTFLNNIIIYSDHLEMVFNFCRNENKITFINKRDLIAVYPCSDSSCLAAQTSFYANIFLYQNCFIVQIPFPAA